MDDRKQQRKEYKKQAKRSAKEAYRKACQTGTFEGFGGFGSYTSSDGRHFIEGIANINGGSFNELTVEGICNCTGALDCKRLDIVGIINSKGDVTVGELFCEGTAKIKGAVKTQEAHIQGVADVSERLEADKIICEGVLRVRNEISADLVDARGAIVADEIVGDKVVIRSEVKSFLRHFLREYDLIGLIEATTIELRNVRAHTVNGRDIRIGPDCQIEHIDCSGTLSIDPSAQVRSISGEHQRVV